MVTVALTSVWSRLECHLFLRIQKLYNYFMPLKRHLSVLSGKIELQAIARKQNHVTHGIRSAFSHASCRRRGPVSSIADSPVETTTMSGGILQSTVASVSSHKNQRAGSHSRSGQSCDLQPRYDLTRKSCLAPGVQICAKQRQTLLVLSDTSHILITSRPFLGDQHLDWRLLGGQE